MQTVWKCTNYICLHCTKIWFFANYNQTFLRSRVPSDLSLVRIQEKYTHANDLCAALKSVKYANGTSDFLWHLDSVQILKHKNYWGKKLRVNYAVAGTSSSISETFTIIQLTHGLLPVDFIAHLSEYWAGVPKVVGQMLLTPSAFLLPLPTFFLFFIGVWFHMALIKVLTMYMQVLCSLFVPTPIFLGWEIFDNFTKTKQWFVIPKLSFY